MFSLKAVLVAASVFAIANTQYSIDPDTVNPSTRNSWCTTQKSSCPLLCLQLQGQSSTTEANDCDPTTLTYECICGNGMSPNASEYSQTLPYFLCVDFGERCVKNCGGNNLCQSDCRKNNPCGAQDPKRVNVTTTSSALSATPTDGGVAQGTDGVVYTGLAGDSEPSETAAAGSGSSSTPSSGAETMFNLGHSYGLAVVFTGIFAGFALVI